MVTATIPVVTAWSRGQKQRTPRLIERAFFGVSPGQGLVSAEGLEPSRPKPYGPQPYASTNSATPTEGVSLASRPDGGLYPGKVTLQFPPFKDRGALPLPPGLHIDPGPAPAVGIQTIKP